MAHFAEFDIGRRNDFSQRAMLPHTAREWPAVGDEQFQDQGHPDKRVAHPPDAGVDHAAVAFAADEGA